MKADEIFHNFAGGPGPDGLEAIRLQLEKVRNRYHARHEQILDLARSMEEHWRGDAAGAARRGAAPLAEAHGRAVATLDAAMDSLACQRDAWYVARNTVRPVPPLPDHPPSLVDVVESGSAGTTYAARVIVARATELANVQAMDTWTRHTEDNIALLQREFAPIDGTAAIVLHPRTAPGTGVLTTPAVESSVPTPPPEVPAPPASPRDVADAPSPARPDVQPSGVPPAGPGPSTPSPGGESTTAAGHQAVTPSLAGPAPATSAVTAKPDGTAPPTAAPPGPPVALPSPGRVTGVAPTAGPATPGTPGRQAARTGTPGTPFVGQPATGRGRGEDSERERKYVVRDDEHLRPDKVNDKVVDPRTGLPVVPPVIG
ncbi:hypothetical protein [Amycolatopsis suaedae]|uniref:hypothetical protein n=1 Tax=Amycolatopsis suaedae TaxID=2510978 RepID=UPI0013EF00F2|nr:hypothetical protein [Amycolatopsis suaedae]